MAFDSDSKSSSSTSSYNSSSSDESSPQWRRIVYHHRPDHPDYVDHGTDEDGDVPMATETTLSPDSPPTPSSGGQQPSHTVQSIFSNFSQRRSALIHALTTDEEAFFEKCDPGLQPLHLYGGTDGSWEVKPAELCLPAPEPQPARGINVARDKMKRHEWLQEVAVRCDAWLINISHFFASDLTANERGRLFNMIISLPTVQEIFLASDTYHRIYLAENQESSSPSEANEVVQEEDVYPEEENERSSGPVEANELVEEQEEEEGSSGPTESTEVVEEEAEEVTSEDSNFCARCGDHYHANGFWICCNSCEQWYHGKCVKINSTEAEHIGYYECPDCCLDKAGYNSD